MRSTTPKPGPDGGSRARAGGQVQSAICADHVAAQRRRRPSRRATPGRSVPSNDARRDDRAATSRVAHRRASRRPTRARVCANSARPATGVALPRARSHPAHRASAGRGASSVRRHLERAVRHRPERREPREPLPAAVVRRDDRRCRATGRRAVRRRTRASRSRARSRRSPSARTTDRAERGPRSGTRRSRRRRRRRTLSAGSGSARIAATPVGARCARQQARRNGASGETGERRIGQSITYASRPSLAARDHDAERRRLDDVGVDRAAEPDANRLVHGASHGPSGRARTARRRRTARR